jgi:hypothetical protein
MHPEIDHLFNLFADPSLYAPRNSITASQLCNTVNAVGYLGTLVWGFARGTREHAGRAQLDSPAPLVLAYCMPNPKLHLSLYGAFVRVGVWLKEQNAGALRQLPGHMILHHRTVRRSWVRTRS